MTETSSSSAVRPILGSFAEDELPEVAWLSVEADLAFLDEGSGIEKADKVDGAIGELSQFHETHSYYAQGVDLTTAKLPNGWQDRLVDFSRATLLRHMRGAWRGTTL